MKLPFLIFFLVCIHLIQAQSAAFKQEEFCHNLNKVIEDGRAENFEALNAVIEKNLLNPYQGYTIKLDGFPITYVDKDKRFVAKTNLNMDSISAVEKFEECKKGVGACLDSVQWYKWTEIPGDDPATVFFKEVKELRAMESTLTLNLAIIRVAAKEYSVVMYIQRKPRK
jgi:hypothetical protein